MLNFNLQKLKEYLDFYKEVKAHILILLPNFKDKFMMQEYKLMTTANSYQR